MARILSMNYIFCTKQSFCILVIMTVQFTDLVFLLWLNLIMISRARYEMTHPDMIVQLK